MMEQRKKVASRKGKTKIIPPKKNDGLSRDEVRSINKKKNIRKRKAKRLAMLVFLAAVVVCAGIALVLTVFFRVETIVVKGDSIYSSKEILAKCGVETGDNLFMISEEKVNNALASGMPYIKSVTLERDMPDTLIINVVDAEAVAAIPYGDGYVIIDADGKILDKDAQNIEGIALVKGLKAVEPVDGGLIAVSGEGNTEDLLEITCAIRDSGIEKITEISYLKKAKFELKYDDRILLEIGPMLNLVEKLKFANGAIADKNSKDIHFVGTFNLSIEGEAHESPGDKYARESTEPTSDVTASTDGSTVPDTTSADAAAQ